MVAVDFVVTAFFFIIGFFIGKQYEKSRDKG
jgi:hypothetical protein